MGHYLSDKALCLFKRFFAINQEFANIASEVIAYRSQNDAVFLIQKRRCALAFSCSVNRLPELREIVEVPAHLIFATSHTRGAHDNTHTVWNFECRKCCSQCVSIFAFDASRDSPSSGIVWHQHHVSTGETDKGREGGAFIAALFLLDLYENFLAFLYLLGDVEATVRICRFVLEVFARYFFEWQKAVAL